ncbi:MAG: TraR/DksA family transcriptional regulator [Candidatus Omnitrophota bacterium]|nr:TraR/DksA family transcriptional regulator [Candidatus Omnitrophota bacterium]
MKKAKKAAKAKRRVAKRAKAIKAVKAPARPKKIKIKRMPKKDLNKYRALLVKEREKIGGGIDHITQDALKTSQREASGDLSGYSFHMADVASDNYEVEFSLGRASDEQNILYTIDEALKRVEDGSYGSCTQCGKQIPKKRLNALPHTELCIACQFKNEKK